MDFSEGEATPEVFAIRFKSGEIGTEFVSAIEKCQSVLNESK